MSTKHVIALVCFIVAAILAVIAALIPPVHGMLVALAIAAITLGLAVSTA